MPYCSNCGTPMEGRYCPNCGASAPGAEFSQPVESPQPGLSINAASALCYLLGVITGVIFLVLAPYNQDKRIRFHAFQSIFLNLAAIVVRIAIAILARIFYAISLSLGILIGPLHAVVSLGFFLIWLYMMLRSYQGVKVVLPIIGPMAERQAADHISPNGTIGRAA